MNKKSAIILWFLITGIFCNSCLDQYNLCTQPTFVSFKSGFYSKTTGVSIQAPLLTIKILDSLNYIYKQVPGISTFNFSLNPLFDSAKYLLQLSSSMPVDTLTLIYTSQRQNVSTECGDIFIHMLSRVRSTRHTIDTVQIINPVINTSSTENLKIYF